jgi:hypothetical protein
MIVGRSIRNNLMKELIDAIIAKHGIGQIDVNPPASAHEISAVERRVGFSLPTDFKTFYSLCNGFGCCNEYIFNMIPLSGIVQPVEDFGPDWFYFSEYMIYAEVWGMRLTGEGKYVIFNNLYPEFTLTSSLYEFLDRFLQGSVFGPGGLSPWQDEILARQNR